MRKKFGKRSDNGKMVVIGIVVVLACFALVDFWMGKSNSIPATVESVWDEVHYDDDSISVDRTYYATVSSNENMGMPVKVSINSGQYRSLDKGNSVTLETARGGITGIVYYRKIRR